MQTPPSVLYKCSTADPTANAELRAQQSAANTSTHNFGFVANPALSNFANLNSIMSANLRCRSFDHAPIHRKVHSLCRNPTDVSPSVLGALGLGLGFGLSLKRKDESPINFDRLCKDVPMRYFFRNTPPHTHKLNFPKLCVKSPDWVVPDDAQKQIELALTTFETATNKIFKKSRQVKHVYNLHPSITKALWDIQKSQQFCVIPTNKNLGPAILDKDLYIARAHAGHLGNTSQNMEISKHEAHALDLANFGRILKLP
jgi:hypothetical protein